MTQLEIKYPAHPGFKEKGGTSEEAAVAMLPKAPTLRSRCLSVLVETPATPDEVAEYLGEDILSIRPRISELARMGEIERTNQKRESSRGKASWVWRAVV